MPNLITTLLGSKETYISQYVNDNNKLNAFPYKNKVEINRFVHSVRNDSVIISGGCNEERSTCIIGLTRDTPGCTVILHNGNQFLCPERIRRYGVNALNWDANIYCDMTKTEILSMLISDDRDADLATFYAFAFDVCEILELPISIEGMNSIDWLGIKWQQDLLTNLNERDKALDLLARFDAPMSAKAERAVVKLERLSRTRGIRGSGISEALRNGKVIVKEVYGSTSDISRQCMEIITAKAEEGQKFTLVLDNIYLDSPLIKDNFTNVRLILSAADITQYAPDMKITHRPCSKVIYRHSEYGSCETISRIYFGSYGRVYSDVNIGCSKTFLEPKTMTKSVTLRQERDTRLKPEMIANIPTGCAFIRLTNGIEGYISLM